MFEFLPVIYSLINIDTHLLSFALMTKLTKQKVVSNLASKFSNDLTLSTTFV